MTVSSRNTPAIAGSRGAKRPAGFGQGARRLLRRGVGLRLDEARPPSLVAEPTADLQGEAGLAHATRPGEQAHPHRTLPAAPVAELVELRAAAMEGTMRSYRSGFFPWVPASRRQRSRWFYPCSQPRDIGVNRRALRPASGLPCTDGERRAIGWRSSPSTRFQDERPYARPSPPCPPFWRRPLLGTTPRFHRRCLARSPSFF